MWQDLFLLIWLTDAQKKFDKLIRIRYFFFVPDSASFDLSLSGAGLSLTKHFTGQRSAWLIQSLLEVDF